MPRIAVFSPIVTLDLDTKKVNIDFGGSLQDIQYTGDDTSLTSNSNDKFTAGLMMDDIIDALPHDEPHQQAMLLRNLAAHIDQFTIQEQELT